MLHAACCMLNAACLKPESEKVLQECRIHLIVGDFNACNECKTEIIQMQQSVASGNLLADKVST